LSEARRKYLLKALKFFLGFVETSFHSRFPHQFYMKEMKHAYLLRGILKEALPHLISHCRILNNYIKH